jgi:hypothetical protein
MYSKNKILILENTKTQKDVQKVNSVIFEIHEHRPLPINQQTILSIFLLLFYRLVWCPGQNKRIAPFIHRCRKRRLEEQHSHLR